MCVLSDSCKTDSPNLKEKLCKQKIGFLQSLTFVDLQAGRVVRKSMGRSVRTKTHVPQSCHCPDGEIGRRDAVKMRCLTT